MRRRAGSTQPDLIVTFTDFQTPAPLATASVVVTQGAAIVGTAHAARHPATTATLALPAAVGQYTLRVIGTPNARAASARSAFAWHRRPRPRPASRRLARRQHHRAIGAGRSDGSTLGATLTVTTAGAYTFTYADDQFPAALATPPAFALVPGQPADRGPRSRLPGHAHLEPRHLSRCLRGRAGGSRRRRRGCYGVTVTGPGGVSPLLERRLSGGLCWAGLAAANNPSAQSLTLTVTDFAVSRRADERERSGHLRRHHVGERFGDGGCIHFHGPGGGAAGVELRRRGPATARDGSRHLRGRFDFGLGQLSCNPPAASAAAARLPMPSFPRSRSRPAAITPRPTISISRRRSSRLQFAVAQNRTILKQAIGGAAGSVSFTATAGSGGAAGRCDAGGRNATGCSTSTCKRPQRVALVFDQVQPVSTVGGFTSQPITLGTSGNFDVTLTDLNFPA